MRILIADDDVTSRLVLTGVLTKNGHEVVATVDGTQALEAMQRPDAPKLAILDWMMPGLAGVDVCRRVRAEPSDHPPYLILLTSRGEKADIVTGLEAGADDYLAKPFDPGELQARVDVGRRMVELQVTLSEARDALDYEARHDPLTGALNRRAFNEILSRELAGERRHKHGLALGICDVDQFKRVNDTFGHQAGDEVLCGIVRRLQTTLREHDVLGRYGGDEFVVLTDHVGGDAALVPYERACAAVANGPIPTKAGDVSITITFGVKVWRTDDTEDALLAAADAALYQAKQAGGNRARLAPDAGAFTDGRA
jgi:diguanylate cyclase (GGDEF)-like protein